VSITVYGAGAIGGITGARLAQAGHDVLLVDKAADHVAAMNVGGLTIDSRTGSVTIAVRAITPDGLGTGLELVLLAVKSQDTPAALQVLGSRLAPGGAIVSLQNGLNEEFIARAVGAERTVGCLVNWAADWQAPGRILHGGDGALVLGELDGRRSERVQELAKILDVVSPTRVSDNIPGLRGPSTCTARSSCHCGGGRARLQRWSRRSPIQQMLVMLTLENMAVAERAGIRLLSFDRVRSDRLPRGGAGRRRRPHARR
jgi:hypothetical protein